MRKSLTPVSLERTSWVTKQYESTLADDDSSIVILTPRTAAAVEELDASVFWNLPSDFFISISGLIGAGKTTLAKALSTRLGLPVYHEEVVDTELLQEFYGDPAAHAFHLQISLLNQRFRQQQEIIWRSEGAVQDRSIYEDGVFARVLWQQGHLSEKEYETYKALFENMRRFMTHPSLIVHLDVSPEEALQRIHARGRPYEIDAITLEYLQQLHASYQWFLGYIGKMVRVVRIDWESFAETDTVVDEILKAYESF